TLVFLSDASDLVAGLTDANGTRDLYRYDRLQNTNTLISHASGSTSTTANGEPTWHATSGNGQRVLYSSSASNVVSGVTDVNGTNEDVFVFDGVTGESSLVSHAKGLPGQTGNGVAEATAISADGEWVLFGSDAETATGDNNAAADVFVAQRRYVVTPSTG